MQPANIGPEQPGNLIAHRAWVHVYLNGKYWGLYDMTERVDQDFARAYGDSQADYDIISQSGAVDGDMTGYQELLSKCRTARDNPANASAWRAVEDILDCDNYIDYLIVNMFMVNTDWPGNNWRAVRRRPTDAMDNRTHKFKFLVWDAEFAFDGRFVGLNRVTQSSGAAAAHSILINHPDYQTAFKARVAKHFVDSQGAFSVNAGDHKAVEFFDNAMAELQPLLYTESARWGDGWAGDNFDGSGYAFTFADAPQWSQDDERGGWTDTTNFHRDDFIEPRRALFLNHLRASNLAD